MPAPSAVAGPAVTRAELRRSRVEGGLEELDRWLADQVRTGLAGLPKLGYGHFDAIAARMVDAQAPGVAGLLRGIPAGFGTADWPDRLLHELAGLHLLSRAHARIDDLPADLAATVRSRVGYPTAKADVLAGPGVPDSWWAVGAVDVTDQQLRRRRVWLHGVETGLTGVWLTFAPPGMSFDESVLPGLGYTATAHRYPGVGQPRLLIGEASDRSPSPLRWAGDSVARTRARFADLVAADPWTVRMATAMTGRPQRGDDGWWWRDTAGDCCRLVTDADGAGAGGVGATAQPWPLLALSAGEPLTVFGEWSAAGLAPLSVLPDDQGRLFTTALHG